MDSRALVHFPSGRQFALTWSIPDDFGGMTSAMLHRSRAFVSLTGTPVDVLTFDARPDYPAVEQRLRASGELVDGMRLVNLWDWWRDNDAEPTDAGVRHVFSPLEGDGWQTTSRDGAVLSRSRLDDGGAVLQVDYYRTDGTLLASDRRDVEQPGTKGGRSVVLCDRRGEPVRSWGSVWGFYRHWLDRVRHGQPSFMIVDSKTVASMIMTYRRKNVVTMHVVHNSHLVGLDPRGPIRASRREVFENLDAIDAVVLLTHRQRADVEQLLGHHDNLAVIGNGRDLEVTSPEFAPDVSAGVMLASLTPRKRVDAAVRAIAAVAADHPDVHLDVFGDGPERERVATLTAELDAPVRLHGHRSDARERLAEASFMLLTSTSEGLPLVLVEAMAAGCIPIAYDVPYGPADIIRDGKNGLLVPAGDERALIRAISWLQSASPRAVARMRRKARASARAFSDLTITREWAREMRSAEARKLANRERERLDQSRVR